jgi:hypothetical protein
VQSFITVALFVFITISLRLKTKSVLNEIEYRAKE